MNPGVDSALCQLHLEPQRGFVLVNLCLGSASFHLPAGLARPDVLHRKADSGAEIFAPVPLDSEGGEFCVELVAQFVERAVCYVKGVFRRKRKEMFREAGDASSNVLDGFSQEYSRSWGNTIAGRKSVHDQATAHRFVLVPCTNSVTA